MTLAGDLVTIFGIPAHPLLVHAVVVLLPLAAVCAAALAVRPSWRQRYAWPAELDLMASVHLGQILLEVVNIGDVLTRRWSSNFRERNGSWFCRFP